MATRGRKTSTKTARRRPGPACRRVRARRPIGKATRSARSPQRRPRREAILVRRARRVFGARLRGDAARRRGEAGRRRQGHDLSLLRRQGDVVPGTGALHAHAGDRQFEALATSTSRSPVLAERLVDLFATAKIFGSRRKDVIRLIISEGPRFPAHRGVLLSRGAEPGIRGLRNRFCSARSNAAKSVIAGWLQFPQLLAAPVLVAIVWTVRCSRQQAPLDVRAMLDAHLDILLNRDGDRS